LSAAVTGPAVAIGATAEDRPAGSLAADADYMKMRLSRMALMEPQGMKPPPGIVSPLDRLKRYCESVAIKIDK
jgi:hypothetical protein